MSTPSKRKRAVYRKFNSQIVNYLSTQLEVSKTIIYLSLKNDKKTNNEIGDTIRSKYKELSKAMEDSLKSILPKPT